MDVQKIVVFNVDMGFPYHCGVAVIGDFTFVEIGSKEARKNYNTPHSPCLELTPANIRKVEAVYQCGLILATTAENAMEKDLIEAVEKGLYTCGFHSEVDFTNHKTKNVSVFFSKVSPKRPKIRTRYRY